MLTPFIPPLNPRYAIGYSKANAPLAQDLYADDVGTTGLFLASDLSRCVTGVTLYVDNGLHVRGGGGGGLVGLTLGFGCDGMDVCLLPRRAALASLLNGFHQLYTHPPPPLNPPTGHGHGPRLRGHAGLPGLSPQQQQTLRAIRIASQLLCIA